MTGILLLLGVVALAYANGSNDISKGIATLVGSGVSYYRRAILWGTVWTVAGSLAAGIFSKALVATFSSGVIAPHVQLPNAFPMAVLIGATGWVLLATRMGLPVSTTHAITGALCGAAIIAFGWPGVLWISLGKKILLPLLLSPLISFAALWILFPAMQSMFAPLNKKCACAEARVAQSLAAASSAGAVLQEVDLQAMRVVVDHLDDCQARSTVIAGVVLGDGLHWVSSALTSFARGLNDAPKIVALGLLLTLTVHRDSTSLFVVVALAMGLGSVVAGRRVTETLAEKITPMNPVEGLSANLVTSFLVAFASHWGFPVSTTHVSTGAITGVGLCRKQPAVRWNTVWALLQAWVITLPVSAALAAAALPLLKQLSF